MMVQVSFPKINVQNCAENIPATLEYADVDIINDIANTDPSDTRDIATVKRTFDTKKTGLR